MLNFTCLGSLYAVTAAHFERLVRPYTVPCDRPVKQDYPEGKDKQEQEKNSNIVSNKVKKVNLAEPGPSCTMTQTMERVSSLFEYCNSDCPSASELNLLTTLS